MIQDIVDKINEKISDCLNVENSIYFGIAHTISVNNEVYPVVPQSRVYPVSESTNKLIKVCPNDKIDLQVYHKITDFGFSESSNESGYSFGVAPTYEIEAKAKMIVVLKSSITERNPSYNPDNFGLIIPRKIKLADYKLITTNTTRVTLDHDAIVSREWKKIDYTKHKCKFLVFEVEYNIRAVTCKLSCTNFLLLEDSYETLQDSSAILT